MIEKLSFLKDTPAKIMLLIFLANFFYDDPTLYLYKRVLFSILIYYAIWEIGKLYFESTSSLNPIKMPAFYNIYVPLLIAFVFISLSKDLTNPNLKWITLLNNPYSLLSVGPF